MRAAEASACPRGPAISPRHHIVVDATATGALDVRVDMACAPLETMDCPEALVIGATATQPAIETTYDCVPVPLDGPEDHVRIAHPGGHLVVTDPMGSARWVILRDAAGTCLAAGSEGDAVWDAPPGDYVATFDNANGERFPISARGTCGTVLDCAAPPLVTCGMVLRGNTAASTPDRTSLYSCSDQVLDGWEDIWLLDNPREQVVSLRVVSGNPALRAMLLSSCDEGRCLAGPEQGDCALLPAGTAVNWS